MIPKCRKSNIKGNAVNYTLKSIEPRANYGLVSVKITYTHNRIGNSPTHSFDINLEGADLLQFIAELHKASHDLRTVLQR